jgi:hypothetical protein
MARISKRRLTFSSTYVLFRLFSEYYKELGLNGPTFGDLKLFSVVMNVGLLDFD